MSILMQTVNTPTSEIRGGTNYLRVSSAVRSLTVSNFILAASTPTVAWMVNANSNSSRLFVKVPTNSRSLPSQMGPAKILTRTFFLTSRDQDTKN